MIALWCLTWPVTDEPTPRPIDAGPIGDDAGTSAAGRTDTTNTDTTDTDTTDTDTTATGAAGTATGRIWSRMPGWLRVTGWSTQVRWLVFSAVTLLVLVLVCAVLGVYGVVRIGRSADARTTADSRVATACAALETRLNRLAPPGAAAGPDERATAIRYENVALEPLLVELGRVADDRGSYRSFRADWQRLVEAREQFARDLDAQAQTGRPAFFVLARSDGRNVAGHLTRHGPRTCDAAARRLVAPDL